MHEADLKLLRLMRTRGHSPGLESAAKALGKAGNNGAVWVVLGIALALLDPERRESWLICAALGPISIGLNYGIKLLVKRPRPVLEGLPPLGGAPSSLSFPSAHALSSFAVATAMFRVDPATALMNIGEPGGQSTGMVSRSDDFRIGSVDIVCSRSMAVCKIRRESPRFEPSATKAMF